MRRDAPDWHNAPVPAWGRRDARLLVVGLAPGRGGANRTGVPFTGDDSGRFLFAGLRRAGFAEESTGPRGHRLIETRITNVVRCLPPGNHPRPEEVRSCGTYLVRELGELLRGGRRRRPIAILTLGGIAHRATLAALGRTASSLPFAHGAEGDLGGGARLLSTYHPSRLNTNTGRLTQASFDAVLARIRAHLGS